MQRSRLACLLLSLLVAACGLAAEPPAAASRPATGPVAPRATLRAFESQQAFDALLGQWRAEADERQRRMQARAKSVAGAPPPPAAPMAAEAAAPALDSISLTAGAAADDAITNVQTAGVDEGGIVKKQGDYLVVLRRGRLFTLRVGADALRPVSRVDAFAPGTDPSGAWYDEMLVSDGTVVVIGYSYQRGGTEIGLFDLDRDGGLAYRATYHLRSNDYYSSRNYASRLVDGKLVFYTPMQLNPWSGHGDGDFYPALRRWHEGARPEEFRRILPATRIYRGGGELDPFESGLALHTVSICDLGRRDGMRCQSSAVLGQSGRVFYVSGDSVFVWTGGGGRSGDASVFRIPLDGGAPSGLRASGSPVDQMSFLQDAGGHLNVLLAARGDGEGMWNAEGKRGDMALLRVRLDAFGDGSEIAPHSAYRPLPGIDDTQVQNRYVGDWLVYGAAPGRWRAAGRDGAAPPPAYALRYAGNEAVQPLRLGHGVERIEAMGRDAVLVGGAGKDLHFTSLALGRDRALPGAVFVQRDAAQGESRTHGFFYRAQGERAGIIGLPIVGQAHADDMTRYTAGSASVLYLRNTDLRLQAMGRLDARPPRSDDDGCKASCVDWYGDARPIFVGERVFALLGYELVEGQVRDGRIVERRRVDFTPAPAAAIAR